MDKVGKSFEFTKNETKKWDYAFGHTIKQFSKVVINLSHTVRIKLSVNDHWGNSC